MKTMFAGSLIALGLMSVTPALAQGVYVGPGGVGVDTGIHRYRDNDRAGRRYDRDDEGRSAYRERAYRDRYQRDDD